MESGKPDIVTRPAWDTAILREHPAFAPPSHDEVRSFASSLGRAQMTDEQKFLEWAIREEDNARANIASLLSSGGSQERLTENLKALALALMKQGRFYEAAEVASDGDGNALPDLKSALDTIKQYHHACEIDDDEFCNCDRPAVTIPNVRGQQVEIELNRRTAMGQVYSPKHGKVVKVWCCSVCGECNAHDNIPERQVKIEELRGVVAGQVSNAFNQAEYDLMTGASSGLTDDVLLKR